VAQEMIRKNSCVSLSVKMASCSSLGTEKDAGVIFTKQRNVGNPSYARKVSIGRSIVKSGATQRKGWF